MPHSVQRVKSSWRQVLQQLIVKNALAVGNIERIKQQPRALHHAPLTNIQKLLRQLLLKREFLIVFINIQEKVPQM